MLRMKSDLQDIETVFVDAESIKLLVQELFDAALSDSKDSSKFIDALNNARSDLVKLVDNSI